MLSQRGGDKERVRGRETERVVVCVRENAESAWGRQGESERGHEEEGEQVSERTDRRE